MKSYYQVMAFNKTPFAVFAHPTDNDRIALDGLINRYPNSPMLVYGFLERKAEYNKFGIPITTFVHLEDDAMTPFLAPLLSLTEYGCCHVYWSLREDAIFIGGERDVIQTNIEEFIDDVIHSQEYKPTITSMLKVYRELTTQFM